MYESLLNWLIFTPCIGAVACLLLPADKSRNVALGTSIITLLMTIVLTLQFQIGHSGPQFVTSLDWIPAIHVQYKVGLDGLSLPLVFLTSALSVLVIGAGWKIEKSANVFMALYLFLLSGMYGVFCSLDLVLFYVFFEISLLPMYFLIGVWGGPRKEYAAIKFFLYTLAGSICLLIVMLGIYNVTSASLAGNNSWDMMFLQSEEMRRLFSPSGEYWNFARWAFWLTFVAFAIKIPVAPFHTWLPDAHVEAPTPISMILAGVLLKMGGYALMRITYPLFPDAASLYWECVATIGVFGIIYGALCAMAQTDWKKLVAYSSVSHMGYVTLGIAVLTRTGFDGAYYQMIGHGITSAMMFFLVGVVYERAHHRQINNFGGLWLQWPKYGGWSMLGFFAGMGLPGLCGFIGEVMVLLGTFQAASRPGVDPTTVYILGSFAAFGVVLTAGYILWMFQRIYMGKTRPEYDHYEKPCAREYAIMVTLGVAALIFGIAPILVFSYTSATFNTLMSVIGLAGAMN